MPTRNRPWRKLKSLLAATCLLAAPGLHADEPVKWALMVEPSFMDHQMRRPIEGSQRTILAVARVIDGQPEPLTREQKRGIPITFDDVRREAGKTAAEVLAGIEPQIVRDKKGVIEFVVLESADPLTASTVLAPGFAEKFRNLLGPDLLVAMPTRFQLFVFSRQDIIWRRMGETIIAGYLEATYPVSREIFALEKGRLRSLGEYR